MSSLVAQLTGRPDRRPHLREDVPVPAGVPVPNPRGRNRRSVQRRSAAAMMMGMHEAEDQDDSIIPDDAQEIENIAGPSGIRLDDEPMKRDREAREPDSPPETGGDTQDRLLSPRDALVAPDVTPQALEPIDASEVPQGKATEQGNVPRFVKPEQAQVNPMDVLLGRTRAQATEMPPPESVMTAESAQATVNTLLSVGGSGEVLLQQNVPMPSPAQGNASKIMEAFSRYGPVKTRGF